MKTIIDDTVAVLLSIGLKATEVETPPGFKGLQVTLPHESQAFFIWAKIDNQDYAFRLARFWASENPFSMLVVPNLIDALARTQELARQ